jgi:hypothetical protein
MVKIALKVKTLLRSCVRIVRIGTKHIFIKQFLKIISNYFEK